MVDTFYNDILGTPDSDVSFSIYNGKDGITNKFYKDKSDRLRSFGTVHSVFEMHNLMYKSLNLISPKLLFVPDFPDYLLSEDDPKYLSETPVLSVSDGMEMPHHRNDLYSRHYVEYDRLSKIPTPTITWGTVRQEPGGTIPFKGTQEVKPRPREFLAVFNPEFRKYYQENPNLISKYGDLTNYIEIYGQTFDNLVQYNIWTRTSWEAEELTDWFINYLKEYTGMYREAGIVQMWYHGRVRDDTLIQIKNRYHLRSLLYYYRTETIDISTIQPIRKIEANINVNTMNKNIGGIYTDDFVAEQFDDKLLSKWHRSVTS